MFYILCLNLISFFNFQKTNNLNEMMIKIWFSINVLKELDNTIRFIEIKKKEVKKREVCRMYVSFGYCKFKSNCMFLHTKDYDIIKLTICKFKSNCHNRECKFGHIDQIENQENNSISDDICGICWDNIYTSNKRFGILSNCEHKFCIYCIRKHKQNYELPVGNRNSCPICRITSYGYIASKFFLTGKEKKYEFNRCEKKRLTIQCRDKNCTKLLCGFKHI